MKMNRGWSIVCVAGVALLAGAGDAVDVQRISSADLQVGKIVIVGHLGKSLGTYETVEGMRKADDSKSDEFLLLVDTLNGKKLEKPVTLALRGLDRPAVGTHCVYRGYEWGAMEGFVADPDDPAMAGSRSPGFYTWFEVKKNLSKQTTPKSKASTNGGI